MRTSQGDLLFFVNGVSQVSSFLHSQCGGLSDVYHILDIENNALSWNSAMFFSGLDIRPNIFWNLTTFSIFSPQGVAASNLPTTVFAVIDMYGKCAQVVNSSILQDFLQISIVCIVLMMSSTGVFDG